MAMSTMMLSGLKNLEFNKLHDWLDDSIKTKSYLLGQGYQASLYHYQDEGHNLVIKTPSGQGLTGMLQQRMLQNESNVYKKLEGLKGIPRCYGLFDDRYLLLEYIPGTSIRDAQITDEAAFFEDLLTLIKSMHQVGVAHSDIKKKDNVLVVDGCIPYLVDFGAAIVYKQGIAPINHYLYNVSEAFDFNAWIKLKYKGRYDDVSEVDRPYLNRTNVEKTARWLKQRLFVK